MRVLWLFACREFSQALHNLWLVLSVAALLLLSLSLSLLDSAPSGQLAASPLQITVVGLTSLGVYLIPLIGLLISFDSLVGEQEQSTLPLLMSYPISGWQLLAGKFLGSLWVIVIAVLIGYGSSGLVLMFNHSNGTEGWQSFVLLLCSSVLLGAVFLALGILVSALANKRSSAIALSLSLWLVLVVLYDLGVLALILNSQEGSISETVFIGLLLSNPADAYRVLNLASPEVGKLVGIWGSADISIAGALSYMTLWIVLSLWGASTLLKRKKL